MLILNAYGKFVLYKHKYKKEAKLKKLRTYSKARIHKHKKKSEKQLELF
jgi:hypothetical protein